jgi:DNA modification methylase
MPKAVKNSRKYVVTRLDGKKQLVEDNLVKERYGFFPWSVWKAKHDKKLAKLVGDNSDVLLRESGRSFPVKGAGYVYKGAREIPLSRFSEDIATRCLQIWTKPGDVVLDPFMGRGTRVILAAHYGRYAIGIDVVPDYVKHVASRICELQLGSNATLLCEDSTKYLRKFAYDSIDAVFTCPPYWNVEQYMHADGQLSDIETYSEFIAKIACVLNDLCMCVKSGGFVVFVVGNFRKDGKLVDFARDVKNLAKVNGFDLWDEIISVLRSPFYAQSLILVEKYHRTVKNHEYILVFRRQ